MNIYNYKSIILNLKIKYKILFFSIIFILSGCSESVNENKKKDVTSLNDTVVVDAILVQKENIINKETNASVVLNEKINEASGNYEKDDTVIANKIIEKKIAKIIPIDINKTTIKKKVIPKEKILLENNSNNEVIKNEIIAIKNFIRDDIKNIVIDNTTGLVWQDDLVLYKQWVKTKNYDRASYFDTSGDTAISYCNELSLGGFDDWKLPSIEDLRTIKKSDEANETIINIFKNIKLKGYWSSTQFPGFVKAAWYIDFANGHEFGYAKNIHLNVRCVRDNI